MNTFILLGLAPLLIFPFFNIVNKRLNKPERFSWECIFKGEIFFFIPFLLIILIIDLNLDSLINLYMMVMPMCVMISVKSFFEEHKWKAILVGIIVFGGFFVVLNNDCSNSDEVKIANIFLGFVIALILWGLELKMSQLILYIKHKMVGY